MKKLLSVLVCHDIYDQFGHHFLPLHTDKISWIRGEFDGKNQDFPGELGKADVIITRKDLSPDQRIIAKNLKLIQIPIAGYEHFDLEYYKSRGIYVCNNNGANAPAVAEHVFLLILALYRKFIYHWQKATLGPWENKKYENLELLNKKIGIVGLGHCGKEVCKRASGFGMKVFYFDTTRASGVFEKKHKIHFLPLNDLLAHCDIISLHVPLTSHTYRLMNSRRLKLMPPHSILINTARGEVVDETSLIHSLQTNHIAGAGLDVFEKEPLPQDSPLKTLSNVVLTPHCGPSFESTLRLCKNMINNILKIKGNRPPSGQVVNFENLTSSQKAMLL